MSELSDEQIAEMSPKAVLVWVMHKAMRDGDFELALDAAAKAAPYFDHPMAPKET